MKYFIISHAPYSWKIPFEITEITVDGYVSLNGVRASKYIGKKMDSEIGFGGIRAYSAINAIISNCDPEEAVFVGSYRTFIGKKVEENWRVALPSDHARLIVSPEIFEESYQTLVALDLPCNVDILIGTPLNFGYSVLQQYAAAHHLDDLLLAVSCAIRAGLVSQAAAAAVLSGSIMIPIWFASSAKIRMDFNERMQWCATEFFYKHNIPRTDYQRRVIDFAFERVVAIYLYQLVNTEGIRTAASKQIVVSPTGFYQKTI